MDKRSAAQDQKIKKLTADRRQQTAKYSETEKKERGERKEESSRKVEG